MDLKNKIYTDLSNGKRITVTDQFKDPSGANVAVLDGKNTIDVNLLSDSNRFEEYIDPKAFFKNDSVYNIFAEKIKAIPSNILDSIPKDESEDITLPYDQEIEREILERKAKEMINNDPGAGVRRQMEMLKEMMGEDEDIGPIPVIQPHQQQNRETQVNVVENVQPISVDRKPVINQHQDDPILTMFRNVKRTTQFKISIDFEDKVPRVDFIEMLEDSYEKSIVDYLSDEFIRKILADPSIIRNKIKEEILKMVSENSNPKKYINETTKAKPQKITKTIDKSPKNPIVKKESIQK